MSLVILAYHGMPLLKLNGKGVRLIDKMFGALTPL